MNSNHKKMIEASLRLSPTNSYDNGYPVYFLTGKNYLYQTLFCIKSLVNASDKKFKFILVDDGSFDQNLIKQVNNQLPNGVIILRDEIDRNLEKLIPEKDFPILHRKRKEYAHIKKLTDIHTISGGWKLVFDSDMLFWNNPKEIIDWLSKPNAPLHIVDCEQSYGYPTALMKTLCKHEIPERVNVGIIGLNSSEINWEDIEIWIKELEKQGGKSYYLEQAVSAMIIAQSKPVVLDKKNYIVNPDKIEANQRSGYLHHYVDVSKAYYFANALKHF